MSRAKDILADEAERRRKKRYKKLLSSVQNEHISPYNNDRNAGATYTLEHIKHITQPVNKPSLTRRPDWKKDTAKHARIEAQQRRFASWPRDRQRWVEGIDDAVSDFIEADTVFVNSIDDDDISEIASAHNEYCMAFNEVWRRLCSFTRETPRSIETEQRQWAGLDEGRKKVGYVHYLALRWSASSQMPVEDFVGLFAELAYTLATSDEISFQSGFYYVETLSTLFKSRAKDLYRAEKMTNKRKANYDTVSLDALDAHGLALHEVLSSPGADPLTHVLGQDYLYDTRLSPEERKVAELLVEGNSYTEIAQELGYSHHEQVRRIHKRLNKIFATDL